MLKYIQDFIAHHKNHIHQKYILLIYFNLIQESE